MCMWRVQTVATQLYTGRYLGGLREGKGGYRKSISAVLVLILVEVDPDVCVSGPRQGLSGAFGFGALKKGAVQFYSLNEQSEKQQVTSNRPWTSYRLQCVYLTSMVGWPQYYLVCPG